MDPTARQQRIRDAIARLEDAFPAHQARAIIGYAEALGSVTALSAEPREPALEGALQPFLDLLASWERRLEIDDELGQLGERSRLSICTNNLADAITRARCSNV